MNQWTQDRWNDARRLYEDKSAYVKNSAEYAKGLARDAKEWAYDAKEWAYDAKDHALSSYGRVLSRGRSRWESLSATDGALFKTMLFTVGVFIGSCLTRPFRKLRPILGIASAALAVYFIWRLFFAEEE